MALILLASCSFCQDASTEMWFDLKRSCWKLDLGQCQVKVIAWSEKVMLLTSRSISSSWPHFRCFIALACLYQKVLWKSCWWHFMTWSVLGVMKGVTGHSFPIQSVNSTCNPMFESVENGFRLKQVLFSFLPLNFNGEVTKLTWP